MGSLVSALLLRMTRKVFILKMNFVYPCYSYLFFSCILISFMKTYLSSFEISLKDKGDHALVFLNDKCNTFFISILTSLCFRT